MSGERKLGFINNQASCTNARSNEQDHFNSHQTVES
jgi:hypothetical protein